MYKYKTQQLLAQLCLWFEESDENLSAALDNRASKVISYINANLAEKLTLDDLSDYFYVSKYHFMREFKSYTNRTIHQYIISKRVNQAKLMMQSGASPTNIYHQCGFSDYSCFYKAFLKEMNVSPRQYASAYRQTGR